MPRSLNHELEQEPSKGEYNVWYTPSSLSYEGNNRAKTKRKAPTRMEQERATFET